MTFYRLIFETFWENGEKDTPLFQNFPKENFFEFSRAFRENKENTKTSPIILGNSRNFKNAQNEPL